MTEKIKIHFVGTGSPIPTVRRNHPATIIKYKNETILIDCGEGTQRQFRKGNLNPCKINKILITHWHGDHTLGLAGLIQTLIMNGYKGELQIHGPKGTENEMELLISTHLSNYFKHQTKEYGSNLKIVTKEHKPGKIISTEEWEINATPINHSCQGLAYSFKIKEKKRIDKNKLENLNLPEGPLRGQIAKGKVIDFKGKKIDGEKMLYVEPSKKITLITDSAYLPELVNFAKDSDLLICEATHSIEENEELTKSHGHLNSHQAAKIAKESNSKKLALIHLSQRYESTPKKILNEAKEVFKNTIIPEDLDQIEV